jgi:hypothetical protein
MKTFKGDFYKMLERIKNKEHFSYSKFSDGELFILQGKSFSLGPHSHSYENSEDFKDFDATRHSFHQQKLLEAFQYKHPNYYIGICAPSDQDDSTFFWMKEQSGQPEENLTWANLFVNSNYDNFRKEMIQEFSNYNIIIVCNQKSTFDDLPFKEKIVKDFRVGSNCIVNDYDLIERVKDYVRENNIKDHLFIFAASSLGNFLCHQLHKEFPENTYFDAGSTLNPLLGLSIDRGYLSAYEGVSWRGNDTSGDLNREESWKI